jgi:ribonuclease HI
LNEQICIYTDGSALGNPGPGGFAAVMLYKEKRKEIFGGFAKTTNNRMELLAVIEALKMLKSGAQGIPITIYTDSKYVADAIEKGWLKNWVAKNFHNKKNKDLWQQFLPLQSIYKPRFEWVKGHANNKENERCDILAKLAAGKPNLPKDEGYEKVEIKPLTFDF